ncbi:MAG: hypothetical protein EOP48_16870 [Sphingobacteriales bacterium]|nr:MAG: hypothetical protein EOP48_16870 [Sphingobacteriales bacterium]
MAAWNIIRPKKKPEVDPSSLMEPGWQFCSKPGTMNAPGSVFRIDQNNIRRETCDFHIDIQKAEEVFGNSVQTTHLNVGIISRLIGLKGFGLNVNANHQRDYELQFSIGGVVREYLTDKVLHTKLPEIINEIKTYYDATNNYYLVREARSCRSLKYILAKSAVDDLGGEIELQKIISLNGNLFKLAKANEYELTSKFEQPMRVMFLADEIKPTTANLNSSQLELGLMKVTKPLYWQEAD